jgi:hypothetical protein
MTPIDQDGPTESLSCLTYASKTPIMHGKRPSARLLHRPRRSPRSKRPTSISRRVGDILFRKRRTEPPRPRMIQRRLKLSGDNPMAAKPRALLDKRVCRWLPHAITTLGSHPCLRPGLLIGSENGGPQLISRQLLSRSSCPPLASGSGSKNSPCACLGKPGKL